MNSVGDFREAIESRKPGESVTLTVIRDGQPVDIQIHLAGGPPQQRAPGTRL